MDVEVTLVFVQLGVSAQDVKEELQAIRGTSVLLEWLRSMFINVHDESDLDLI